MDFEKSSNPVVALEEKINKSKETRKGEGRIVEEERGGFGGEEGVKSLKQVVVQAIQMGEREREREIKENRDMYVCR